MGRKKRNGKRSKNRKRSESEQPEAKGSRHKAEDADSVADDELDLGDHRSHERIWADIGALFDERQPASEEEVNELLELAMSQGPVPHAKPTTDLGKAQDIMYDAFEARGKQREKLARKALEVCADCADAYVLLAEETAEDLEEAIELYEEGVRAGERALGPEAFEELEGQFWGFIETRPYMRARAGLTFCLWQAGREDEAIEHAHEMLRLNPNDNQGIRGSLAIWLARLNRNDELSRLLDQYEDDGTLEIMWGRAIHTFRTQGPSEAAQERLRETIKRNPHQMQFLFGFKQLPHGPPDYVTLGGEDEAGAAMLSVAFVLQEDAECTEWVLSDLADMLKEFSDGVDER